MARAPALFFRLELPDAIVYKFTTAFVDINFTFLFIDVGIVRLTNLELKYLWYVIALESCILKVLLS